MGPTDETTAGDFASSNVTATGASWSVEYVLIVKNLPQCQKCSCKIKVLQTIGLPLVWVNFCLIKMSTKNFGKEIRKA